MTSDPILTKRVASIDIGTNTILLLIAKTSEGEIKPLFEMETIVKLGENLQKSGVISPEAIARGLQTLTQYLERCQDWEVKDLFAVGTSALREAKNSEVFLKLAKEKLGLSIEVISGEEEAQLSFLAVAKDLRDTGSPVLVVDVGGGSTEFILGRRNQISQWISLPLGSVRCTEQFLHSDPVQEGEWETLEEKVRTLIVTIPHSPQPVSMVAVGGTATALASVELGLEEFIPEKIHHFVLRKEALKNQLSLFRFKTFEERRTIPGLSAARADVILAGGAILYLAMEEVNSPSALISCHGVRYGLLYKKLTP